MYSLNKQNHTQAAFNTIYIFAFHIYIGLSPSLISAMCL